MPTTPSRGGSRRGEGQRKTAGGESGVKLVTDHTVKPHDTVSLGHHHSFVLLSQMPERYLTPFFFI